jgi:hypothetical protein
MPRKPNTGLLWFPELQKAVASQIDVEVMNEDFPGGIPVGGNPEDRLKNFYWFTPGGFSVNNGCTANSLALMNLDCHLDEMLKADANGNLPNGKPNPMPAGIRSSPFLGLGRSAKQKATLWLTDRLYDCIQGKPGESAAEKPWSAFPSMGASLKDMVEVILPCKCEVMDLFGIKDKYLVRGGNPRRPSGTPKVGDYPCGDDPKGITVKSSVAGNKPGWPPVCPCVVGQTMKLGVENQSPRIVGNPRTVVAHALHLTVTECKNGKPTKGRSSEHPYQAVLGVPSIEYTINIDATGTITSSTFGRIYNGPFTGFSGNDILRGAKINDTVCSPTCV